MKVTDVISFDEGWLESKVGCGDGISDEGYLDRSELIDALLDKMEFHVNNISAMCSKIVGGGTKSEVVGP